MALLAGGLIQIVQVNGIGLVTNGLIWQGPEIWFDAQAAMNLTTGWTAAAGYMGSATLVSTAWTAAIGYSGSASVYQTTWTKSAFGSYSEFPS